MSLAAKQEEIQVPVIDDFVYMCDNSFTADDILELERQVCAEMHFNLKCVTPLHYLDPFVMAACVTTEGELSRNAAPSAEKENDRQHQSKVNHRKRRLLSTMAQYLIDLSLNDATLCVKPSNEVCAAAVVLAKLTLGMQVDGEYPVGWNRTMEYYTRCTFLELSRFIEPFLLRSI